MYTQHGVCTTPGMSAQMSHLTDLLGYEAVLVIASRIHGVLNYCLHSSAAAAAAADRSSSALALGFLQLCWVQ